VKREDYSYITLGLNRDSMYFKLFPARGFEAGTVKSDSLALNLLPSVLGRELDRLTEPMLRRWLPYLPGLARVYQVGIKKCVIPE